MKPVVGVIEKPQPLSEKDFERLFREQHRRVLWYFARKGFPPEQAEELMQDTFERVYKGRHDFRGDSQPKTWVLTIAARVFSNEIRRLRAEKRRADEVSLSSTLPSGAELAEVIPNSLISVESQAIEAEQRDHLYQAVARLPPRMRSVLTLFLKEFSYSEIATMLDISRGSIGAHLTTARRKLQEELASMKVETVRASDDDSGSSR